MVTAILTAAAATSLTACTQDPPTETSAPSTQTGTVTASPTPEPSQTAAAVAALIKNNYVDLTTRDLPNPPKGFTRTDVEIFANRAIDILERGVAPELNGKTPAEAFKYVFANQYPETTASVRTATESVAGAYDWEWAWASLFATPPTEPARFLTRRWQVDTLPGTLDDGTTAPQLQVILSTAVEHQVTNTIGTTRTTGTKDDNASTAGTAKTGVVPIVVQRTVVVRGYKPQGGRAWWPAIGIQVDLLFGGKCAPVNGSVLTVARNPKTLAEDLKDLRRYLNNPRQIDGSARSKTGSLATFVDRYCEDDQRD